MSMNPEDSCPGDIFDYMLIIFFWVGACAPAVAFGRMWVASKRGEPVQWFVVGFLSLFFLIWNGMLFFNAPWCIAPFVGWPLGLASAGYYVHRQMQRGMDDAFFRGGAPNPEFASQLEQRGNNAPDLMKPPPAYIPDATAPPAPASEWEQYSAPEDGKPYWHNRTTGETTWTKPY